MVYYKKHQQAYGLENYFQMKTSQGAVEQVVWVQMEALVVLVEDTSETSVGMLVADKIAEIEIDKLAVGVDRPILEVADIPVAVVIDNCLMSKKELPVVETLEACVVFEPR